ncbi:hypothetical protein MtrunA17_Chr7g0275371 [Medicago truncatula]|uniref:Uncharacterized protein n=1 Tax=Medicago truncatula TaxID=3880 RepID=A0A396HF41_MEDTR|nr:hypothetical protein MtrunA17_Chr7g0275371 [Medicago truncatula]
MFYPSHPIPTSSNQCFLLNNSSRGNSAAVVIGCFFLIQTKFTSIQSEICHICIDHSISRGCNYTHSCYLIHIQRGVALD